jgi:hypothetical protein
MSHITPATYPASARAFLPFTLAALSLAAVLAASGVAAVAATGPESLLTPAEACDFRCTPSYRETIDFIGRLTAASPLLRLGFFGESAEGYPLPVVIGADGRLADPEKARKSGRPIVLIFSGIHAGEIDGKDASLTLLRDIAAGESAPLLDRLILLVVPIYNVDGHERIRPSNRLAQDGPVAGMGFRTNGRGLDLNRDFVQMEAPETVALVGNLFRRWRPHVVVDCHVTDGLDFQYVMTHFAGESLNTPPSLAEYVGRMKKAIDRGVTAAGYKSGSFFNLVDSTDPASGFRTWAPTPRYSTTYFEAHNRVSLLAEAHAHKPFRDRVAATLAMLRAILEEVASDPEAVVDAVRRAEEETVRRVKEAAPFALEMEPSDHAEMVEFEAWEHRVVKSEVTGGKRVLWSDRPVTHRVPMYRTLEATRQIRLPRGYLLSRAYGHLAAKARLHGLRVEQTLEEREMDVVAYRVKEMTWSDRSYQGHHVATAAVEPAVERRKIPAGTYWIPLDQPSGLLAPWLFEPESPDGFLHWNFFDNVLERKMVVEETVLEEMAAEQLRDPEVRAAYEKALESDPAMRREPSSRLWWFYNRSPYFDEQVGLYSVFRVTGELGIRTSAWTPEP